MKHIIFIIVAIFFCGVFLASHATMAIAGGKIGVIVVDVQGDFTTLKNGSAATRTLSEKGYLIFATQDWHPADHMSFFSNHPGKKPFEAIQIEGRTQVMWPVHCVQGTENARILVDNNLFMAVVQKGKDTRYDSYSGFQDDGGAKTEMDSILKRNGIQKLFVYGIATDYCVKATAIDAAEAGYDVTVIEGLCRSVAPDTSAKALQEMKGKGITIEKELKL
jgi:nicotinamidase/pyrazinamidase